MCHYPHNNCSTCLAKMIDTVSSYCSKFGLEFNPNKSKIMVFSKTVVNLDSLCPVYLRGRIIEYVKSIKYLGTTICSDPLLTFSSVNELRSFYRASNAILNAHKKPKEEVLMYLLFTNCVPILNYANAVKSYSSREMSDCNTAVNNAIRRIFGFHRWSSIKHLREGLGYKSIYESFAKARNSFERSLSSHHNNILRSLYFFNTQIDIV